MFRITLKRSAATLGVVAGLLAAAGPASAMPLNAEYDGMEGGSVVSRPEQTAQTLQHEGAKDTNALIDYEGTTFDVKAAVSFGAGKDRGLGRAGFEIGDELFEFPVASEGVNAPTKANPAGKTMAEDSFTGSAWHQSVVEGLAAAPGTQVGSEGVKAPVVVLTGANDYGFTEGNDRGIRSMRTERGDVRNHFEITDVGREYLRLVDETDLR